MNYRSEDERADTSEASELQVCITTKGMQKKNTWKDVNGPECNQ